MGAGACMCSMPSAHPPALTRPAAMSPDHRSRSGNAASQLPWSGSWSGRPRRLHPPVRSGCASHCAAPDGRCAIGVRNQPRVVRSRLVRGGCATGARAPDLLLRRAGSRTAQVPHEIRMTCSCAWACGSVAYGARGHPAPARRPRADAMPFPRPSRGWACGRADHDPDHGLRVPIVTVVGPSWSVVGSGPAGFLKVSKQTF